MESSGPTGQLADFAHCCAIWKGQPAARDIGGYCIYGTFYDMI